MNFRLETRAGVPTVVWDDGMCRTASGPEVELWRKNERLREALWSCLTILESYFFDDDSEHGITSPVVLAMQQARQALAGEVGDE